VATIKHSGYSASAATVLSTELNSLASAARAISSAIDNTTALDLWDDLELDVTFGTAPTDGSPISIYMIPSIDGTNYVDGDASIAPPANLLVATSTVRAVTTAQKLAFTDVRLRPGKFKYLLENGTNRAFPASGSTLTRRPFNLQES
jgi:hypothetical protein